MGTTELCDLTAVDLAGRIRRGDVSARVVMEQHLARIDAVNPVVNAIVTLLPERALEAAARADEVQARGAALGALHGLPTAHKDVMLTRGVRTTFGSPLLSEFVPNEVPGPMARTVADGDLHRLDALLLLRDGHRPSRDLGARWVHARWAAGGLADRREASRRLGRVATGVRVRAGDGLVSAAAVSRERMT